MTPDGYPTWLRANDHTTYGGHTSKVNYQGEGVVNAQTDVDAAGLCRMAADMEACHRTAPFAVLTWTCNDSPPAAPTMSAVNLMTGVTTNYEGDVAPSGFPSGARNGNGDVTFTFAGSYSDAYGVSAALTIHHALPSSNTYGVAVDAEVSGSTVRARAIAISTGTASADASGTLVIA